MRISRERLQAEAQSSGFRLEILEKVLQLLNLLERFQDHPFLKGRLALKGGTALNLFVFDLPRLSVDIDLNYVGAVERAKMLDERPKVEAALQAVCSREGMSVVRQPDDHAGGKWRLRYESSVTEGGNLEIDLNYMFRMPLWPVANRDSRPVGSARARAVPVLDIHELAAGKLAALLSRHAGRDLFDVHQLLTHADLDREKLRLGFVLYGAMNRRDWRTVIADDVTAAGRDVEIQLLPLLRAELADALGRAGEGAAALVDNCRQLMEMVLPLADNEMEFLNRLLDRGEVVPSLLTSEQQMGRRIASHPLLQWKALNVRRYRGENHDGGNQDG